MKVTVTTETTEREAQVIAEALATQYGDDVEV
jgi:hypothetical protein